LHLTEDPDRPVPARHRIDLQRRENLAVRKAGLSDWKNLPLQRSFARQALIILRRRWFSLHFPPNYGSTPRGFFGTFVLSGS
jgi:hypothetical protein